MNTSNLIDESHWYLHIGCQIREARKEIGLTQQELAEKANLKRTSITNIEKGVQKTPVYSLYMLSAVLNKPLFELIPSIPTDTVVTVAGKHAVVTPKSEQLINELLGESTYSLSGATDE